MLYILYLLEPVVKRDLQIQRHGHVPEGRLHRRPVHDDADPLRHEPPLESVELPPARRRPRST